MASNFLKEKLAQAAQKSPSFNSLPLEKQAEMVAELEKASDQQVIEAIKAFEEDSSSQKQSEQGDAAKKQKLIDNANALAKEIEESKDDMEKADKVHEENTHKSEVDAVENELTALTKAAPTKRKKFLGLF